MVIREITIGRSKNSDIYLDDKCVYASNNHGSIYYDGTQMMYRDNSSNGTMINNISVKHRAVPINHGDIIMIAGRYQINWSQIDAFFPPSHQNFSQSIVQQESPVQQALRAAQDSPVVDTDEWNWGAFGLYGLWGFFNGCWWAFFISMFLWWAFPIPNLIFGAYGTRWAWENRHWSSAEHFIETQEAWNVWGVVITILNIIFIVWLGLTYA